MRVGFLNNQIDNRGTGNALFDYAHYNEEILGNESVIFSLEQSTRNAGMYDRLIKRFGEVHTFFTSKPEIRESIDVLYHIKSGYNDGFRGIRNAKYVVHSVFDNNPHGDVYAFVSDWLATRNGGISVPHIVNLPSTTASFRGGLGFREDAIVFGRHGGYDSFDIPFAWDALVEAALIDDRLRFIFLNTRIPDIDFKKVEDRFVFLVDTADPEYKRKFINTCDAMIHARGRGETFGIAVGEFDIAGKPVLTYSNSPERAHYEILRRPITYENKEELITQLVTAESWLFKSREGYRKFTPEYVMKRFDEVFLGSPTAA